MQEPVFTTGVSMIRFISMTINRKLLMAFAATVYVMAFSACTTYKDLQYLQGEIDSVKYSQFKVPVY